MLCQFFGELTVRFTVKAASLIGEELISCLGRANVRAFHENPNRIHTELTFTDQY